MNRFMSLPGQISRCLVTGISLLLLACPVRATDEEVPKSIFLVVEKSQVIASNVQTGQFFDFRFSAKEKLLEKIIANGVAILVTNQRFAGVGVFSSGWKTTRRIAGEDLVSFEAQDYSALIVTTDRILSFNGRTGSWSQTKRGIH